MSWLWMRSDGHGILLNTDNIVAIVVDGPEENLPVGTMVIHTTNGANALIDDPKQCIDDLHAVIPDDESGDIGKMRVWIHSWDKKKDV
jgi:hypothetical protein